MAATKAVLIALTIFVANVAALSVALTMTAMSLGLLGWLPGKTNWKTLTPVLMPTRTRNSSPLTVLPKALGSMSISGVGLASDICDAAPGKMLTAAIAPRSAGVVLVALGPFSNWIRLPSCVAVGVAPEGMAALIAATAVPTKVMNLSLAVTLMATLPGSAAAVPISDCEVRVTRGVNVPV